MKIGYADDIQAETAQEIIKTENYLSRLKELQASLEIAPEATEPTPKKRKYVRKGKTAPKPRNGRRKAAKGLSSEVIHAANTKMVRKALSEQIPLKVGKRAATV
jgi:hypothetical protein